MSGAFEYTIGMKQRVNDVLIVTKSANSVANALGREIAVWLSERGVRVRSVENNSADSSNPGRNFQDISLQEQRPDLILVLGGDGTLLSIARKTVEAGLPILGLNLGKVGFLAELGPDNWRTKLQQLLDGDFSIREHLALDYSLQRGPRTVDSGTVINDVVIARGGLARLVSLRLSVNGEMIGSMRADGLILSTPTGATGYAVSAQGPLLFPGLQAISVTPICPFLGEFHPLVLPADVVLCVEVYDTTTRTYLTLDGQEGITLVNNDRILVRRAQKGFFLAQLDHSSYFRKLRGTGLVGSLFSEENSETDGPGALFTDESPSSESV